MKIESLINSTREIIAVLVIDLYNAERMYHVRYFNNCLPGDANNEAIYWQNKGYLVQMIKGKMETLNYDPTLIENRTK